MKQKADLKNLACASNGGPEADAAAKKRFAKKHYENAAGAKEGGGLSNAAQITNAEKKVFDAFKGEDEPALRAAMHECNLLAGDENYNGVILMPNDMDSIGAIRGLKTKK